MASIINSISFKNFFNYYGDFDDTRYEFEEGVNIVVADNGAGKSKFFNAFLWLFYDQVLDSDDKLKKGVKDIAVKIISDKAKNETPIGDHVTSGIRIEYSTGRNKFQITKSFRAERIGEKITDQKSWLITINDLEVEKTDLVLPKYKPVFDEEEKRSIINQLILPNLRQYSFFQGEEVDRIIDFSKKSSIEEAVRTLTNISKYEDLVKKVKDIADKAEKDLRRQSKSTSEQNSKLEQAQKLKDDFVKQIEDETSILNDFKDLYEKAEQEKNEFEQNYANAEKRRELDLKLAEKNRLLRDAKGEYEKHLDGINSRFFDGSFAWIGLGFQEEVELFKSKVKSFREIRYQKQAVQAVVNDPNRYLTILPSNSPDAVSLQNMIDAEHCYVCDRPAPKGEPPHDHLIRLLERNSKAGQTTKEFYKNNLDDFFGDIQINATPFFSRINSIEDSVLKTREREIELRQRVERISKDVKSLRGQRSDLMISGADDQVQDKLIIDSYKGAIKRMEQASIKIERYSESISKAKSEILKIERELHNLRPKDIPEGYTTNYEMSRDLAIATENAKNRVFDRMVGLLEKYANEHFQNLIKYNDLAGGILKFEKSPTGSIAFNYIDKAGNVASGASTGFQRMKIFSVVMAVISVNTSKYNYPLLADAPVSEFGDGFIRSFFEESGRVFPQSIILAKELYDGDDDQKLSDLGKMLLKEDYVKKVYVNQLPKGAEQIEMTTKPIRLK